MTDQQQLHPTLDDLEHTTWGPPPPDATTLVAAVHNLRQQPVDTLTPEDLRLLIGQPISLDILVPLAVDHLRHDPLLEASLYPGDLLTALAPTPPAFWSTHRELADQLRGLVDDVDSASDYVADAIATLRTHLP